MYLAEIPYFHNDVDVTIGVLDWEPYVPGVTHLAPEYCYPPEGGYGEWEIIEPEWRHLELDDNEVQEAICNYMERQDAILREWEIIEPEWRHLELDDNEVQEAICNYMERQDAILRQI